MSDNHDLSYLKNKRNRDDNHIYTDNSSVKNYVDVIYLLKNNSSFFNKISFKIY